MRLEITFEAKVSQQERTVPSWDLSPEHVTEEKVVGKKI